MNSIRALFLVCVIISGVFPCKAEKQGGFSYVSVPKLDLGTLSFVTVPLCQETGDIWIKDVPAKLFGPARDGVFSAMGCPVYATSTDIEERRKDINLISICKMSISLKPTSKEDEYVLVVDLSKAEEPKGTKFTLAGVVQAALACIRVQFPPNHLGKVNVTIVGGTKGTKWNQFEGPLWPY